jgi:hypothetical protein
MLPIPGRLVGDHEDVLTGGGLAVSAVGQAFRCIDHPNDLQLDPRQQHLEQPTVTTEQHRDAGAVDR